MPEGAGTPKAYHCIWRAIFAQFYERGRLNRYRVKSSIGGSNPPLPPACQVNSYRFNNYLQNQHLTGIRKSLSFLPDTPFYPLFTLFFELNRAKSNSQNHRLRLVYRGTGFNSNGGLIWSGCFADNPHLLSLKGRKGVQRSKANRAPANSCFTRSAPEASDARPEQHSAYSPPIRL